MEEAGKIELAEYFCSIDEIKNHRHLLRVVYHDHAYGQVLRHTVYLELPSELIARKIAETIQRGLE